MDTYVAVHAYAPRSVQRAMMAGVACTGLHRHTVMAMIAHAFLQSRRLKQAKRKKNPGSASSADLASGPGRHHRDLRGVTINTMSALRPTALS
ncbi:hypothetical protein [Chelatococcus sp. YT9]|uniref:hypothetical protein n=1 Tax=Chelatococcus sp. YT9 TaxID=2835635 RepID=UPI001BCA8453|nr:hypothetical protein [Chelatococcus sp. YT9]MBS7701451.1 hypothetical protein [Chelatococcus sp. YT9]